METLSTPHTSDSTPLVFPAQIHAISFMMVEDERSEYDQNFYHSILSPIHKNPYMMWLRTGPSFYRNEMLSVPLSGQMVAVRTLASSLTGAGSNNRDSSLASKRHRLHVTPEPPVAAGQERDKAGPCGKKRTTVLAQQNS